MSKFKKGQSGNPKGRPKKEESITSLLRDKLSKKTGESRKTAADQIAAKLVDMAISGNMDAIREISNRVYGRPKQTSEITTVGTIEIIPPIIPGQENEG